MVEIAIIEGMESYEESNTFKVLDSMLDGKNVETKTELEVPLSMARLLLIADWIDDAGMTRAANRIKNFGKSYMTLVISKDRKSRSEVIAVLAETMKEERNMKQKLTSGSEE